MTSNSLTENEKQDIPSHILKTIFGLHASVIFRPKYLWFPVHLKGPMIPGTVFTKGLKSRVLSLDLSHDLGQNLRLIH